MPGFTVDAVFIFAPSEKFHSVVNLKMHISDCRKRLAAVLNGKGTTLLCDVGAESGLQQDLNGAAL